MRGLQVGDFRTATLMSVAAGTLRSTSAIDETSFGTPSMSVTQGVGTPLWITPEVFTGRVNSYEPPVDVCVFI